MNVSQTARSRAITSEGARNTVTLEGQPERQQPPAGTSRRDFVKTGALAGAALVGGATVGAVRSAGRAKVPENSQALPITGSAVGSASAFQTASELEHQGWQVSIAFRERASHPRAGAI